MVLKYNLDVKKEVQHSNCERSNSAFLKHVQIYSWNEVVLQQWG